MSIETQSAEFDAVETLAAVYADTIQRVPIVDDDYPEARHRYEGALRELIKKLDENGRLPKPPALTMAARVAQFRETVDALPNSREKSLALTKLDECEMWLEKTL